MAKEDKFADEVLTDEELDNVVGGNWDECNSDKAFFKALCANVNNVHDVTRSFKEYGIKYNYNVWSSDNSYSIDGQKYPRSVAYGWVLGAMRYPGYDGNRVFDIEYTDNFIRSHLGNDIV